MDEFIFPPFYYKLYTGINYKKELSRDIKTELNKYCNDVPEGENEWAQEYHLIYNSYILENPRA